MGKKAKSRRLKFITLDVFTRNRLEGNQLAVFTDARGLSDAEMQSIAHEMNLSETTFIFPRAANIEKKHGVKVRIFTIWEELPFAGHPTLGTAFALRGSRNVREIVLDLKAGKVPVCFEPRDGAVFGEMRQLDPVFGDIYDCDEVASVLGISAEEIDRSLPIQTVSTGVPFCMVPFRKLSTLKSLGFSWSRAEAYLRDKDSKFFYLVTRETEGTKATLHARMVFYNGEDPATGSAAGCATAWAVEHGVLPPGKQGMIEQGIEIKRPSQIYIRADRRRGKVADVRVGGYVAEVTRGELVL